MAGASSRETLRHLNTLFHCGAAGQLSDAELLERFVAGRDEGAEAAFAALVDRHGVMVLGVCRRVLGNRDAAEDAFQATFLVLARKAATIGRREQLANWLYGVARRAALDARARANRQQAREKRLGATIPVESPDHVLVSELRSILDEEIARLPERHRAVILLCELEGLSRRGAAARLGISEGTLSSRLARAKARLRDRLTRRGFALSAATLATVMTQDARAALVSPALVESAIRVATLVTTGSSLAGVISISVVTLTEGVLKTMLLAKLKYPLLGLFTLAVVSTSVGVVAQDGPGQSSGNDRLQVLERKLDRLLELMGGQSRPTPVPDLPGGPAPRPTPPRAAVTTLSPLPPVPPAPPAVVPTVPAPAAPATGFIVGVSAPAAPATGFIAGVSAPAAPPSPVLARPASGDLAGRVDRLERRLGELERRIGAIEGRLNARSGDPFERDRSSRRSAPPDSPAGDQPGPAGTYVPPQRESLAPIVRSDEPAQVSPRDRSHDPFATDPEAVSEPNVDARATQPDPPRRSARRPLKPAQNDSPFRTHGGTGP